jgi:hypothetical protein
MVRKTPKAAIIKNPLTILYMMFGDPITESLVRLIVVVSRSLKPLTNKKYI